MNENHDPTPQPKQQPEAAEPREATPQPPPKIYVASLSDYNNGRLHGTWMDAAREPQDIRDDIAAMLARSRDPGAEEWAIHNFEQFGRWRVHEYDSIDLVSKIARGIQAHGHAFAAWADLNESEPERFADFTNAYLGHYSSVETYAFQTGADLGYEHELEKLPEHLQPYTHIDYAAIARDMELSGDITTVDDPSGGVWIFRTDA